MAQWLAYWPLESETMCSLSIHNVQIYKTCLDQIKEHIVLI